jgi:hypothetical protein
VQVARQTFASPAIAGGIQLGTGVFSVKVLTTAIAIGESKAQGISPQGEAGKLAIAL